MNGFDLALFSIKSLLLAHAVPLTLILVVAAVVLSVVFFGTGPAVLAFLRSRVGQLLIALVVAGIVGWELKGYVDDSVALQRQLAADRREAERALADERLRTKAAEQRAAEARRQAEDQRAVASKAAAAEADAHAYAADLQTQAEDLNDELADAKTHTAADRDCHRLTRTDVGGLRRIGAAGSREPR